MHSRSLMGTPSNLSKKIGTAAATVRQQNDIQQPGVVTSDMKIMVEPTSETMVGKRTEWLEKQERRLSATMQEQKTEHDKMKARVESVEANSHAQAMQLFQDAQWMYGWTTTELFGIESIDGKLYEALGAYRAATTSELSSLAPAGRWALLSYPMEEVSRENGAVEMLMKMRTVNVNTGQPSLCWAVVVTRHSSGECQRAIGEFTIAPYPK